VLDVPPSAAASETVAGLLKIATAAEAQAFTANKAIDGAKLAAAMQGANQSLAESGYQKLPGGLIIQWGRTGAIAQGGNVAVTFPITFPIGILQPFANSISSGNNTNVYSVSAYNPSASGMNISNNSNTSGVTTAAWLAIGK
jgi:hypothetical protein